ncbi:phosphoribosylanthranilate isomerase [soil metagenome]|jgi:phosphoribosylanthranilate isomerase
MLNNRVTELTLTFVATGRDCPGESKLENMTRIKVCGITNVEDARLAADAGADAIGLIFAESRRQVDAVQARKIVAVLPDEVLRVGVFVNEEPERIRQLADEVGLDYVQLHGDESPQTVTDLRARSLKVIKALRVRDSASLEALEDYEPELFLLDAYSEKARGGTGERFDWELAKALKEYANILVSGGLAPENVRAAVEFFEPYGVDASSSLEDAPGKKNDERVRRFVNAAKS